MICAANWKMNMGYGEAQRFLFKFKNLLESEEEKNKFLFFPPACLAGLFAGESFLWGAQNVYFKGRGAFTGENSLETLEEMGAQFCLLGHSERRHIFGESDVEIEKKFHFIHERGLIPVLCAGEAAAEREKKSAAIKRQLGWIKTYEKYKSLPWRADRRPKGFEKIPFIVAYEPVWAIGSGETPSPEEISETHQLIKEHLSFDGALVFYGGSVTKENAALFGREAEVEGLLAGGASLKAEEFYSLYKAAASGPLSLV